ncbi:putative thioredoxin peroxidase [Ceraceosorus guamensis]|uniref:Putative thioredoxin peroxidase n=1 Tax=Ceraceosorus guamensis TaxID=1522189 RepID=A0A316WC70_9BASI|nr:putative thioredoxin peroxidase [Ceraceosorus guamensis]PWN46231.1 putative thioredoxin peroxidase [Ceraceosorus guamensis]
MTGTLRLGSTVPDFAASTNKGDFQFHDYINGSWAILFSHPDDFTPVCTTELGEAARQQGEFDKRGVKLIGLSANDIDSHDRWIKDITDVSKANVTFPIIGDKDRKIATTFDMLDQLDETNKDVKGLPLTVRSVFVINPNKQIVTIITYPASVGRNFDEILRVIDSLQLSASLQGKVTTPVNWRKGDDVIIAPPVKDEEAKQLFGNFRAEKPYLRFTPDPSKK